MKKNKAIITWLLSGCALIFIMVVVGGITRLTNSGLSMVNWSLFMGAIPPLNDIQWQETFELYKQSPEFKKINYDYTLSDFKYIFFWEYLHRMIGRLLGLVFIIPFIYFLFKKMLSKKLLIQSLLLFFLGALQGAIGWWMVKSGLVDRPDVSHFRLAIHLTTAFITCAFCLWVALPLIFNDKIKGDKKIFNSILTLGALVLIQIVYGAFVAGLNAGIGFNTWPKMNGEWVPQAVYSLSPFWKNFVHGPYGIQFFHRTFAFIIVAFIIYICKKGISKSISSQHNKALYMLLSIILLQTTIGILTIVLIVPFSLALIHQLIAFLMLMSIVYCLFIFKEN